MTQKRSFEEFSKMVQEHNDTVRANAKLLSDYLDVCKNILPFLTDPIEGLEGMHHGLMLASAGQTRNRSLWLLKDGRLAELGQGSEGKLCLFPLVPEGVASHYDTVAIIDSLIGFVETRSNDSKSQAAQLQARTKPDEAVA